MCIKGFEPCRIAPVLPNDVTHIYDILIVGNDGIEPPEPKHLIYSQARYQLRNTSPKNIKSRQKARREMLFLELPFLSVFGGQ
jgi:hypothetical protein